VLQGRRGRAGNLLVDSPAPTATMDLCPTRSRPLGGVPPHVAIPRKSKPTAARSEFEHRRAFREKVKWRTGSEGRINHLKRTYGWNRTDLTNIHGARIWCGHGVFAHNLVKIGALAG
jgi:IS5 family transposase